MDSTYNEGKSVVAKRFIGTLKNKIYKHMTTVSQKVYFDVLHDIVDKYNNAYHNTIKKKTIDVKSNSYAEYNVDSNEKDPKFKIGDHATISKYKNIFANGYAPNWSAEVFVIKKAKNTARWTYVILFYVNDLNGEEIIETFMKKSCRRLVKKNSE